MNGHVLIHIFLRWLIVFIGYSSEDATLKKPAVKYVNLKDPR